LCHFDLHFGRGLHQREGIQVGDGYAHRYPRYLDHLANQAESPERNRMAEDLSNWIRLRDFAAHLGVSLPTVRRWARDGRIPGAYRTPGGHLRIPREAVAVIRQPIEPASRPSRARR
jgi:excisionase family DNA binding protein